MEGISIIGSGNVGERIGKYFSSEYDIIFYDINENVIKKLNDFGYISTLDLNYALESSDISFIAVPTPLARNNLYDNSFLEDVSYKIRDYLKTAEKYHIFVIKSTAVPGTTENMINIIEDSGKQEGKDFGVVYNPEFLTVINNTWTNNKDFCISPSNESRIILGEGSHKRAGDVIQRLYEKMNSKIPILRTDFKTAEFSKLAVNNRLTLSISFSNEIFLECEELKKHKIYIDSDFVMKSIAMDPRIGRYGSVFGLGYSGPCFLKDTIAFNNYIKNKNGNFPKIISQSIEINNEMIEKYGKRE